MLNLSAHCVTVSIDKASRPGFERDRSAGQLTGQDKQDDPVDNQDGPKHRDIEDGEPATQEADGDGTGGRVPELELRQAADERPELVILLGGQAGAGVAIFQTFILGEGGIELRGKEGEEEVQEVDAQSVGHYWRDRLA